MALGAGFQTHLAKPIQPMELMVAIGTLVRGAPAATQGEVFEP
jgi:hypothetical protein